MVGGALEFGRMWQGLIIAHGFALLFTHYRAISAIFFARGVIALANFKMWCGGTAGKGCGNKDGDKAVN